MIRIYNILILAAAILTGCEEQNQKRQLGACDKQDAVVFFISYHNKVHGAKVNGTLESIFNSHIASIEPYGKIDTRTGTRVCKATIKNHSYKAPSQTSVACFSFVPKTGAFNLITDLPGCCVPYESMETKTNPVCWF